MTTSAPQVVQLFDAASSTYTYLIFDPQSLDAVIIDPVVEQLERDQQVIQSKGLKLSWALETHAHADHITSAGLLAEHFGVKTAAPEGCHIGTAAVQLVDGQILPFGSFALKALHTPGHTAGSMCFLPVNARGLACFYGRYFAHQWLWPNRFSIGQCRSHVSQPDRNFVQVARAHHRLAGS
jgi:sulfur dioxygenase